MCERRIKQTYSRCPALVSKLIALKPDIFYRKPSINWCPGSRRGIACFPSFPMTTTPTHSAPHSYFAKTPSLKCIRTNHTHASPKFLKM